MSIKIESDVRVKILFPIQSILWSPNDKSIKASIEMLAINKPITILQKNFLVI